jgi:hypothetical protein
MIHSNYENGKLVEKQGHKAMGLRKVILRLPGCRIGGIACFLDMYKKTINQSDDVFFILMLGTIHYHYV